MIECPQCQADVAAELASCPACRASLVAPALATAPFDAPEPPPEGLVRRVFRFARSFGSGERFRFSFNFKLSYESRSGRSDPVEPPEQ